MVYVRQGEFFSRNARDFLKRCHVHANGWSVACTMAPLRVTVNYQFSQFDYDKKLLRSDLSNTQTVFCLNPQICFQMVEFKAIV